MFANEVTVRKQSARGKVILLVYQSLNHSKPCRTGRQEVEGDMIVSPCTRVENQLKFSVKSPFWKGTPQFYTAGIVWQYCPMPRWETGRKFGAVSLQSAILALILCLLRNYSVIQHIQYHSTAKMPFGLRERKQKFYQSAVLVVAPFSGMLQEEFNSNKHWL